jgi:hypothetical protein
MVAPAPAPADGQHSCRSPCTCPCCYDNIPLHTPAETATCLCLPHPCPNNNQCNHRQSRKDEFDLDDDPEAAAEAAERGDEGAAAGGKFAWSNSDREYTYDELLGECTCVDAAELLLPLLQVFCAVLGLSPHASVCCSGAGQLYDSLLCMA